MSNTPDSELICKGARMKDQYKTKKQLIEELEVLRNQLVGPKNAEANRIHAEEALRESEATLRALINAPTDSVLLLDTRGVILDLNKIAAERLGKSRDELIGTLADDSLPEDIAKRRRSIISQIFETSREVRFEDERDGIWYDTVVHPITDKDGEVSRLAIIARDITERKRTEEALIKSELRFRNCFDLPLIGFAITSPEKGWIEVNDRICSILGYARDEIVRKSWSELTHPDDLAADIEQFNLVLSGQIEKYSMDKRFIRKDGEMVWTSISVGCVRDLDGRVDYFIGLMEDITERKRTEEKIHTYQEQLRSLSSELSLIEERERRHIATDLHDHIGHNLAIIKIKLGALREMAFPSGPIGPVDEIQNLIEQAIHYTRSLTSELSPPVLYELGFEAAVEWLTEQIQDQHHIQVDFEDDRQFKPMSDEIRISLFKAVRELLINIAKHSRAHKAKVSTRREDNIIRIIVEDDGVGFSIPEDKSLTKIGGFGLFNVHERLKYLKGDFEIDSKPGQGTRITLVVPLTKEENDNRSVT